MYQMHVDYPLCRDKDGDQGRVWFPTELAMQCVATPHLVTAESSATTMAEI